MRLDREVIAGAIAVASVAASGVIGSPNAPQLQAQSPASDVGHPTFEVASIKPNKSGTGRIEVGMPLGGRFKALNVPLRMVIQQAYQLQDFQIVGGPAWIGSDRFDIDARAGADVAPTPPGAIGPLQLMIQSLLTDRFHLRVHNEVRELPTFELVLARADGKPGPQLKTAGEQCAPVSVPGGLPVPSPPPPSPAVAGAQACPSLAGPWFIVGRQMTMAQLAGGLSTRVSRRVVDRTGLPGHFDFDLTYTPDSMTAGQPIQFNGVEFYPGPSIVTALQEQLGLKLESARGPVEVLVIDSVDQPTPD